MGDSIKQMNLDAELTKILLICNLIELMDSGAELLNKLLICKTIKQMALDAELLNNLLIRKPTKQMDLNAKFSNTYNESNQDAELLNRNIDLTKTSSSEEIFTSLNHCTICKRMGCLYRIDQCKVN